MEKIKEQNKTKRKTKSKTKTKQANTLKVTIGAISLICDQKRPQLSLLRPLTYCSDYASVCFILTLEFETITVTDLEEKNLHSKYLKFKYIG